MPPVAHRGRNGREHGRAHALESAARHAQARKDALARRQVLHLRWQLYAPTLANAWSLREPMAEELAPWKRLAEERQAKLEETQRAFDEFQGDSRDLEAELESSLSRSEAKV